MTTHPSDPAFYTTPLGKFVIWHLQYQFPLFPIHGITAAGHCTCPAGPGCERPGKHPYTRHGFKDASKDPDRIAALFDHRGDLNVGIATGKDAGVVVIDLDGEAGQASWETLCATHPHSPVQPGMTFLTGKGRHLLFRHPGAAVRSRQKLAGYEGIDVRADGGYIVAPPSVHHSGRKYQVAENTHRLGIPHAPAWLLALLMADAQRKAPAADYAATSGATPQWGEEEVRRMLAVLDPGMGNDEWVAVGMALHDGGFPLSLWDEWSRGSTKYSNGCCVPRWRSFHPGQGVTMGTLVDKARARGWKPRPQERSHEPVDVSGVAPLVEKIRARAPATVAPEKPAEPEAADKAAPEWQIGYDPMELPGMIGDTVRWITHHAFFEQPELAYLNVLAFAGACLGRRYASPMDTRTNIYLVGIDRTGGGKDFSRKMVQSLAARAGLSAFIGGNAVRSASGLARDLEGRASQIMMLDEFGLFLQALSDPKAMPYMRETAKVLMEFYSASNGSYNHGAYGDAKAKPIVVHEPNLCIYGTTTLETYLPALKRGAVSSGSLNRFVVIPSTAKLFVKRRVPPVEYPEALTEVWGRLAPGLADGLYAANAGGVSGRRTTAEWGIGVEDAVFAMREKQLQMTHGGDALGALWARYAENVIKVAMIFAVARDPAEPVIRTDDLGYGRGLVERSIRFMEELAAEHMAENEHEANGQEMLRVIRSAAGGVTRRDLLRRFRRLRKKEIEELISSLVEEGAVEAEASDRPQGGGSPSVRYRAT